MVYEGRVNAHIGPGLPIVQFEDLQLLLSVVRDRWPKDEVLFLLACDAGLRRCEILHADSRHVFLPDRLQVPVGKGGTSRYTVLTPRLRDCVSSFCRDHGRGPLCLYSYHSLREVLSRAVEASGLDARVTWHGMRHYFATRLIDGGLPLHEVSGLLGHRWVHSTAYYLHVRSSRFLQASDVLSSPPFDPDRRPVFRILEGGAA